MPKSSLRIDILGTSFTITVDEDPVYLESLLNRYRISIENTQKITGIRDPLKIAIITGYMLCEEIQKLQKERGVQGDTDAREAERLTRDMITRIDAVLDKRLGGPVQAPPRLYKLENTVKKYDWGSPEWIPALLGRKNDGAEPWAELWMGVHPAAPSVAEAGAERVGLADLIRRDPVFYLGEAVNREFGALPFLYKLLAAGKPLSIQAHPNREQALAGWDRENRAGLAPDDTHRNYRDANHKPEILCALSPFRAMCGFREIPEILKRLERFSEEAPPPLDAGLGQLRRALEREDAAAGLREFLGSLFALSLENRQALGGYALHEGDRLAERHPEYAEEWKTAAYFALLYPGDPAVIAPLYLNLLNLAPGEAIFLPAGILHAYIEGFGVELMANSDNVLRGGLTAKHVDAGELARILEFRPFYPAIVRAPGEGAVPGAPYTYPANCREFSLSVIRGTGERIPFSRGGPHIFIVTRGRAELSCSKGAETLTLLPGESAFLAAGPAGPGAETPAEALSLMGDFTLYAAGPGPDTGPSP
ncbi:MAG: mannose-6-phosphate isomerase, class I [Treponema sp.]|nr:mannose-6-phosphate isomerase, class I [Treponema sp.]